MNQDDMEKLNKKIDLMLKWVRTTNFIVAVILGILLIYIVKF
jgi:hypothetical protein